MGQTQKSFRAIDVGDGSDGRWAAHLRTLFPQAETWLTDEGRTAAGAQRARKLFAEHLPELEPLLDRLAQQTDRPGAETFLTMAALKPFFSGCTQAGGSGRLVRNYDFAPDECEATIVRSRFLRPVIGMQEAGWGLLDGMNDAGLAVSLTFGGRALTGPGFAVNIVLRYLLETCQTVTEAVQLLRTIPIMIAWNVTLVDADRAVTVYLGPDIELTEAPDGCAANHQHLPVSAEDERATRTQLRLAAIRASGGDVAAMLRPPLYESGFDDRYGTLYTADYQPQQHRVVFHWPGESWEQSFDRYTTGSRTITLVDPGRPPADALTRPIRHD
jgi:predicted choloylglycine hydrolase